MENNSVGSFERFKEPEGILFSNMLAFRAANFLFPHSVGKTLIAEGWSLGDWSRISFTHDANWIDVRLGFRSTTGQAKALIITFSGTEDKLIAITEVIEPLALVDTRNEPLPFALEQPSFSPELTTPDLALSQAHLRRESFVNELFEFFKSDLHPPRLSSTSDDTISNTTSDTTSTTSKGTSGTTTPNDEDMQEDTDIDHMSDNMDDHTTDTHDDPDE